MYGRVHHGAKSITITILIYAHLKSFGAIWPGFSYEINLLVLHMLGFVQDYGVLCFRCSS